MSKPREATSVAINKFLFNLKALIIWVLSCYNLSPCKVNAWMPEIYI